MRVEGFEVPELIADGERVTAVVEGVVSENRVVPDVAQIVRGEVFPADAVRKVIDDLMHGDEEGTVIALRAIRAASPVASGCAGYSDDELKGTARESADYNSTRPSDVGPVGEGEEYPEVGRDA
jgi:hypothetical protein